MSLCCCLQTAETWPLHPNAGQIERLYSALRCGDANAAARLYTDDAHFSDIAFDLEGRESIRQMWRFVSSRQPSVTFQGIQADDTQGKGHWQADYVFSETGRPVSNLIESSFSFQDGLIKLHHDRCNAWVWANQAFGFPKSLVPSLFPSLRRAKAAVLLTQFSKENPG